jgi:hemoglobin
MSDSNTQDTPVAPFELFGANEEERLTNVRQLVDHFYDVMDSNPAYKRIRNLHPPHLNGARDKLFWFLSGWLGGPDLYQSRFGHPRLRMRHMPFAIASEDRDQWLLCMAHALKQMNLPDRLVEGLMLSFFRTADFMRNQADPPGSNSALKNKVGIRGLSDDLNSASSDGVQK